MGAVLNVSTGPDGIVGQLGGVFKGWIWLSEFEEISKRVKKTKLS
jgi:hypothetical protein